MTGAVERERRNERERKMRQIEGRVKWKNEKETKKKREK